MIIMLSSGEYSDYVCDALYQGDREKLQKGFQAYCDKVGNREIDSRPEELEFILAGFQCKKLEYEEVSWDRPDALHKFIGIEKQEFLVRVSFQKELNILAYSHKEAETLAGKQHAALQKDAQAGFPIMKPKVISIQKLGT